jgi:hypothetical protein
MLQKNILPPSSGWQLVQVDAHVLQWPVPSSPAIQPAHLAQCLPPHPFISHMDQLNPLEAASSVTPQNVTTNTAYYMVQTPKR